MDVDDAARRRLAIRALQATGRIPRTPDFAGGETEASPSGTQGPPALQGPGHQQDANWSALSSSTVVPHEY